MAEPYHVRPFPREPHRGGKELNEALDAIEKGMGAELPDFVAIDDAQKMMHEAADHFTDDLLVDMLRTVSKKIDIFRQEPSNDKLQKLAEAILKVRVQLKSL